MAGTKHKAGIAIVTSPRPARSMCNGTAFLSLARMAAFGGGLAICVHASPQILLHSAAPAGHRQSSDGLPFAGRLAMALHSAAMVPYRAETAAGSSPPHSGMEQAVEDTGKGFVLGGGMTPAVADTIRDLPELARRIVEEHPRVQSLRAEVRAARMEVDQARAVNGLHIATFSDAGGSNSNGSSGVRGDLGVRARYPVQDWGKGEAEIAQAEAKLKVAKARLDGEVYTAWQKLSDAFIAVIRARSSVEISEGYVDMLMELRQQVGEIVTLDKGRSIDLRQVENRIGQAKLQLMERKIQEYDALIQLREMLNLPALRVEKLDDVGASLPATVQAALARLDEHPSIIESSHAISDAEQSVHLHRAQEKPRVDLQATLSSRDSFGKYRAFGSQDVRLVLEWDAFDGGSARSKTSAAAERLRAAADRAQVLRRDLQAEVGRGFSRSRDLTARTALWHAQIGLATKLRADFIDQFRVGRRTVLDLLSATNDIYQAQLNAQTDRFDMLSAEYRLYIQLGLARSEWMGSTAVEQ